MTCVNPSAVEHLKKMASVLVTGMGKKSWSHRLNPWAEGFRSRSHSVYLYNGMATINPFIKHWCTEDISGREYHKQPAELGLIAMSWWGYVTHTKNSSYVQNGILAGASRWCTPTVDGYIYLAIYEDNSTHDWFHHCRQAFRPSLWWVHTLTFLLSVGL